YGHAKKRLLNTREKLLREGLFDAYEGVLYEWLKDGVIEEVSGDGFPAYYLPHRAVVKENSTTKIRPVFDASAHDKGKPSLNSCLEKGSNLIEEIPTILNRFRLNRIGVISDIKRAFLQISLAPND